MELEDHHVSPWGQMLDFLFPLAFSFFIVRQHFERRDIISNREVLGFCAQDIDRVMSVLMRRTKSKLLAAMDKMEVQLVAIEGNMR